MGRKRETVPRLIHSLLSVVCWTLALAAAMVTAGALLGNDVRCEGGESAWCAPHILVLVIGALVTLALAAAGVALRTSKPKSRSRKP
jgi:hypothetical protein